MLKVVVADDHPITLMGTELYLRELDCQIVGSYQNGISCLNGIKMLTPDLAVIDLSMPGMSGLEVLAQVKEKKIPTRIILITMHRELPILTKAKQLGCDGYVLKDFAHNELKDCIKAVMDGKVYVSPELNELTTIDKESNTNEKLSMLTSTEIKVLQLVKEHKTNKEIGRFLFITEKTVESHKRNIVTKLGLPNGKNILLQWVLKNEIE